MNILLLPFIFDETVSLGKAASSPTAAQSTILPRPIHFILWTTEDALLCHLESSAFKSNLTSLPRYGKIAKTQFSPIPRIHSHQGALIQRQLSKTKF